MFGIFNAHEFAIGGIESVLASYSSDVYYEASEELQSLDISSEPTIIIEHPAIKQTVASTNTIATE